MVEENKNINQEIEVRVLSKPHSGQIFWAILAYLGSLVIFPFAFRLQHPFVKHHTQQGFLLFLFEIFSTIMILFIPLIGWLIGIIGWLIALIFSLAGLINVCRQNYWLVPGFHKLIKYFKILNY